MTMRTQIRMDLVLALLLVAAPTYAAVDVSWYTIDCGGVLNSTGGSFQVAGTVGQADAGVLIGSGYTLAGGFWPGVGAGACEGDFDGDGTVGLSDLATLLASYGQPGPWAYSDGDLDGDGDVDLNDLAALLAFYGTICPQSP
jgi:hypothetical protein